MQKLQHVHVVEVLGSYSRGKSSSILLLPLADKDLGDFMEELDRDVPSQVELLVKWTVCLVEGLHYIHSQHVKHKDIKPQNLLVHGEKILYTDFGIAHDFEGSVSVTAGNTGMTRRHSAPEVVAGDERSRAADIFSLGCVFLEMLGAILEWGLTISRTMMTTRPTSKKTDVVLLRRSMISNLGRNPSSCAASIPSH